MILYYGSFFLLTLSGGGDMKYQVHKRRGSDIKPGTYYTSPRARLHGVITLNSNTHISNSNTRAARPHNYRFHHRIHDTSHCTLRYHDIIHFRPSPTVIPYVLISNVLRFTDQNFLATSHFPSAMTLHVEVKVKKKQSHRRPGQAPRLRY